MDDFEVMTVLPKELRLGAPPTMPQARSYMYRQQSTLASYNPDQQIQINIPRLQRSYLKKDSTLQFRLTGQYQPKVLGTNGGTYHDYCPDLFLDDAGAWGLFERIEVFDYLGSTVLESTDGIPQLMSLLIDTGASFTDPEHEGPIAHGLASSYVAVNQANSSQKYVVVGDSPIGEAVTIDNTCNQFYVSVGTSTDVQTFTAPNGTYTTREDWLTVFNQWLAGLDIVGMTGHLMAVLESGTTYFSIEHPSQVFKLYAGGAYTNHIFNKLGITVTGGAFPKTAVAERSNVVTSVGTGKSSYTGGFPLTTTGVTTENVLSEFSVQFSIPLPSFLGFLSKKMVPLHNGFTIVLTIASQYKPMFLGTKQSPQILFKQQDQNQASNMLQDLDVEGQNVVEPVAIGSAATWPNQPKWFSSPLVFWWQITDVSLVCQILELGPAAESMLLSTSQGQPLILHTKQLRYYRGAASSSQAEFNLPLNLNVASLTNILWFMRPTAAENVIEQATVGQRIRNYLQRWEFQYGSTVLPQSNGIQAMYSAAPDTTTPISGDFRDRGFMEVFNELIKARPCVPSRGRLSYNNFNSSVYTGLLAGSLYSVTPHHCADGVIGYPRGDVCKFACGLNLELAPGKTGDLICGLNTNGMNTQIRGYFHPSFLSSSTIKLDSVIDAYAEYDAFINISPGIATTVSF